MSLCVFVACDVEGCDTCVDDDECDVCLEGKTLNEDEDACGKTCVPVFIFTCA